MEVVLEGKAQVSGLMFGSVVWMNRHNKKLRIEKRLLVKKCNGSRKLNQVNSIGFEEYKVDSKMTSNNTGFISNIHPTSLLLIQK